MGQNLSAPLPLRQVLLTIINVAYDILPKAMNTPEATVALLTIGQQESRFQYRWQLPRKPGGPKGPARGFWQFELGSRLLGGGVWGVYKHKASRFWLAMVCEKFGVKFEPAAIYAMIEENDVFACCVARLLIFTDAQKIPALNDVEGLWKMYAKRTWVPGSPHRHTWDAFHQKARQALGV